MNIRLLDSLRERMRLGAEAMELEQPIVSDPEWSILIFDRSGSMSEDDYPPSRLLAAFDAGIEYVDAKRNVSPKDVISIILFDDDASVICEDVGLGKALSVLNRLKKENPVGGGTDINAGLLAAEQQLNQAHGNFRNRIVLLTDGHGGHPIKTASRLRAKGVIIDVIGIAGTPEDVAEEELRKVASVVNGETRYRFIGDRAELLKHFKTIATDLVRIR